MIQSDGGTGDSLALEVEGETVFEGTFSTTTASSCGVPLADDLTTGVGSSGPLLEPPSSMEGQLVGSVVFFSLSSRALRALCLITNNTHNYNTTKLTTCVSWVQANTTISNNTVMYIINRGNYKPINLITYSFLFRIE